MDCYYYGSDPLTHKKITEEQANNIPEELPSVNSEINLSNSYEEQFDSRTKPQ
ncbi:hypothetical protein I4U23_010394 [Adineta vaga]|nr:hypothetical protein I4U23_010394 [Adineta vaga]